MPTKLRTRPVAQSSNSNSSPPSSPEDIPVQQARHQMSEVIDSFEFSPDHKDRSYIVEEVKPNKYPSQELRKNKPLSVKPKRDKHRLGRRFMIVLAVLIMAVAAMHVVIFHGLGGGGNTRYLRSKIRSLFKSKPRIIFLGDHFQPIEDRKVEQYPAEYSDQTQLYHTKSSDDTSVATKMERKIFPNHEINKDCVPLAEWQLSTFPTCNNVHETFGGTNGLEDDSLRFLSNAGSWRDAWRYKADVPYSIDDNKQKTDNVILKTIKLHHPLEERYFEFSRVDALAMEQLTSNPYIMNIHDFCGVSVVTERGDDVLGKAIQRLSPRAKVDLAVKVALSLAAVHEHGLVHNDLNADNIFMGKNNNPKLNDFNIAILMMNDTRTNTTCTFPGHFPNAQWKSPEEQESSPKITELTEKVDIYALGNLLFQLATNNRRPWRDMANGVGVSLTPEQKAEVSRLKMEGVLPNVPDWILKLNDPYINLLLETMTQCYQLNPEDRPTAREVAEFLELKKKSLDDNIVEFGRFPKTTAGFETHSKTLATVPLKIMPKGSNSDGNANAETIQPSKVVPMEAKKDMDLKVSNVEVPQVAPAKIVPVKQDTNEERATPAPIVRGPM